MKDIPKECMNCEHLHSGSLHNDDDHYCDKVIDFRKYKLDECEYKKKSAEAL